MDNWKRGNRLDLADVLKRPVATTTRPQTDQTPSQFTSSIPQE